MLEHRIIKKPILARVSDRLARTGKKLQWQQRALPSFLIIGTQKGGTSSLHNYLAQHPRLFPADVKEVNYFGGGSTIKWDKYSEGERLYRSYFPKQAIVREARGQAFEASPEYLHSPLAPERIASLLPLVRLIALLRDPIERTISSYFHEVRRGREDRDIMTALRSEDAEMRDVIAKGNYKDLRWIWRSYITRGLYAVQLKRFFEHFPREQMLILESAEFYAAPAATVRDVLRFIGMDDDGFNPDYAPVGTGTNRTKVDEEVYDFLTERFSNPNRELEALLGRKFDWTK